MELTFVELIPVEQKDKSQEDQPETVEGTKEIGMHGCINAAGAACTGTVKTNGKTTKQVKTPSFLEALSEYL